MNHRVAAASLFSVSRSAHRMALLAGVSAVALGGGAPQVAYARSLNGGSGGFVSAPSIASDAATQAAQQAAVAARQTQNSLARAAKTIQDIQGMQSAARAAAAERQISLTAPVAVPNGLAAGGLVPNSRAGWSGADAPGQSVDANGQTQVGIRQTQSQAILNWTSFNVGARTTLTFDQQGNASWVALNRVNNATAPSQILGSIKADGQVYVVNQSGIVFGGASQINVGSLIASTAGMTDQQFLNSGIYSTQSNGSYVPSFTAAGGKVVVEAGALISTAAPTSVTSGGGVVMLLGSEVVNAGSITTPKGQTLMAAGNDFILRRGFGTDGNQFSTTRGTEIAPVLYAGSTSGTVSNSGIVLSQQGDITLAGHVVIQDGMLISTTSVNQRGTIHLLNSATDTTGGVTLTGNSVSLILPELDSTDTALDSQRDALIADSVIQNAARQNGAVVQFNNLSMLADRQDQSRIEIVTGGSVSFKGGSYTGAQGGQIAVSAGKRIFTEGGATLDASGLRNVALAMASNNISVNVQGNELRDSPQNRDSDVLKNNDVWIDVRSLTLVPAGTGGYASDRYYTSGGLLEVGGYLGTTAHTIGEWAAVGGSITLAAPEVIAQKGAIFDISGGSLEYAAGWIRSTNLIGSDGRRYSVDNAPADMTFVNFAGGFSRTHNIQGKQDDRLTETWTTIFDRGRTSLRWEDGYTVGRDAGRLNLSAPTAIFEADIIADVIAGKRQNSARSRSVSDGYKQVQSAAPLAGILALGRFTSLGLTDLYNSDVRIGTIGNVTDQLALNDTSPAGRANTAWFDARHLSAQGLGGLELGTRGAITIDGDLVLANGGALDLVAPIIDIKANVTAHSGSVTATNTFTSPLVGTALLTLNGKSAIDIRAGVTLDLSGLRGDARSNPSDLSELAYLDGGTVSLQSSQNVVMERDSSIDVTSGFSLLNNGKVQGGRGGDVTLKANSTGVGTGVLTLDGQLRGYGVKGGGALVLQTGSVLIGREADAAQHDTVVLDENFFSRGFGNYTVIGIHDVAVADGATVNVVMPVYQVVASSGSIGLEPWLPPLYLENALSGVLTERGGASLTLQAGTNQAKAADLPSIALTIGKNATINVDAGQSIAASSIGQLTVDGTLRAPGGKLSLKTLDILFDQDRYLALGKVSGRSIWVGENARLDVASVAATALDSRGRRYGLVSDGGSIVIGGEVSDALGQATASNSFIVIRPGAVLDASGAEATLDIPGLGAVDVASNGGSISLASYNGLYLDGTMMARAGGARAAGGTLDVALPTAEVRTSTNDPVTLPIADPRVRAPRVLVIGQTQGDSVLPADLEAGATDASLVYGHARLGADTVTNGGFDNLSVMSDLVQFDGNVNLHLGQSLNIYGQIGLAAGAPRDAHVVLDAAYARLAGFIYGSTSPSTTISRTPVGSAVQPISFDSYLGVTADLIDIRDSTTVNFGLTTLHSNGDLRFLQGVNPVSPGVYSTGLSSNGGITLQAAQIYPATGVKAQVGAALVLRIEATTADTPSVPYSAFGDLMLAAPTVEQGGVVRAPLGHLQIGNGNGKVILLPGSVTSVSGAGLQMPYGGTIDGLTYSYDGKVVKLTGVGGSDGNNLLLGVTLSGVSVDVQHDAVLDLSGGGNLAGAGFVSGRGGSTDARYTPLMRIGSDGKFKLPGSDTNPVYAIVPGVQAGYAPSGSERSALDPVIGQQITLRQGVPGLPAGTYTLMPASYALLPGAFRVELNGPVTQRAPIASMAMGNGSWLAAAQLGIAHTGIGDTLFRQAILTSSAVLRTYSQYDETSYATFALADAARIGVPRAMLEVDAKSLFLDLNPGAGANAFRFNGVGLFGAADGGYGGSVEIAKVGGYTTADFEIVAAGAQATAGFTGVTLDAGVLNAMGASRIVIGGLQYASYGQNGTTINTSLGAHNVVLRSGAVLSAPEVFLSAVGDLTIEKGASINTLGRGKAAYDATDGFNYANGTGFVSVSTVAVSNGVLSMLPGTYSGASGNLQVGGCLTAPCAGDTQLYSEGTIVLGTSGQFALDDAVRYGTRNLTLAVQAINVGDSVALADAASRNALPAGLSLNQAVLDRLLRGDTQYGAPALETLVLSANTSVNFYGTVTLDTIDPATGQSTLDTLVLGTPAIYGSGGAGDVATIRTGHLIWKGSTVAPGTVVAGGAGTGIGTLNIEAARIEFGYGPGTQPTGEDNDARLALGFANVNLRASDRVTANEKGSLSVYQSQGAYQPGTGYQYSGGNLNIEAPLITGEAGSVNSITAGESVRLTAPAGANGAAAAATAALGGELNISGHDILVDTVFALPSGKVTLSAEHDLTLTDRAVIDMAGRTIAFNDVSKYSWGGDVVLESRSGNVRQSAGSLIDLSAQYNRAGTLKALALDDAAGVVDLQGRILGSSSGLYDAGGTLVPYKAAEIEIRAQRLGDSGSLDAQFAALNQRLNDGGVFGTRSFQLKQGDLTIGDGLRAGEINVSVDNGSLTVLGAIDASGLSVGSIYLAASNNLTIAGSALLDAHGTTLRVDSYGKIIDSPNRAIVNLTSGEGQLTLASGARIDLRAGTDAAIGSEAYQNDGLPRGTLELNAHRTGETSGDIRIDASGTLDIRGARSIAVNGTWQYDDAAYGTDPAASGRPYQVINQAYLDAKNVKSMAFMDAALANGDLMNNKLAGLRAYNDAFHLRPGVEIVSATPDGDLVVQGDLDLSGYRYASVNPKTQKTGVYGSGEPGALVIRAGGNLDIYGSINDGFAPPPVTQDDNGWLLLPGVNFNGSDTVVPRGGVVIADGTAYQGGATLNYDLPLKAMSFKAGIVIPAPSTLTAPLAVPAGTVFSAAVRDASGNIIHPAGSILGAAETLPPGTRLDAGMRLPGAASLAAFVWPKGVPLPLQTGANNYVLNGNLTLPLGALLPSATNIKLPSGVDSIDLRPSVNSRQGALWALAPMLPEGSQSWSLRLAAGADTTAADSRIVQAHPKQGDLRLADAHYGMFGLATGGYGWSQEAIDLIGDPNLHAGDPIDPTLAGYDSAAQLCSDIPEYCIVGNITYLPTAASSRFSVVRTGAADLELLAGLNLRMDTLYGVYTAGTSSQGTGASDPYNLPRAIGPNGTVLNDKDGYNEKFVDGGPDSLARAWYPTGGGNLTVKARGDLTGDLMQQLPGGGNSRPNPQDTGYASAAIGTWLWRQGSGATLGQDNDQPTAWWINFGSYVPSFGSGTADRMVGFTGFGTLGGGNLRMDVGGDAGILSQRGELLNGGAHNMHSQGLVLAVGSTGRVLADGSLSLTGGGDIDLRIGGTLNPFTQDAVYNQDNADKNAALTGAIVNLRGDMQLQAGSIGNMPLQYGVFVSSVRDTRSTDPFAATGTRAQLGLVLAPGDSNYSISTRGDLVIKGVDDPGRVTLANKTPFSVNGDKGSGESWFSLWTAHTAINLFSAGGDLTPITPNGNNAIAGDNASTDSAFVYPSILSAVAASGSLYYGNAAKLNRNGIDTGDLLLAPSANGRLEFLSAGSIYAEGYDVSQSGASAAAMATPFHPAFSGTTNGGVTKSNLSANGNGASIGPDGIYPLFAFGPDTVSGEWDFGDPARFYAVNGDLVGVSSGRVITYAVDDPTRAGQKWYQGGPVWMMAGRDIVGSGTAIGKDEVVSNFITGKYSSADNLFVNGDATDVSKVSAGRDILYSSFSVAGPGTLEISAGRNVLMADKGRVSSLGPVASGDNRPGASIVLQAGVGASGPDYAALLRYLDPANQVPAGTPLEGSGKVAKTYEMELAAWLKQRYGFEGSIEEARSYFGTLAPEQQHIFLRQVYYAELTAGGREYNDPASTRFQSYLRGREMIAALFPGKDADGSPTADQGDITMFGGSGISTLFGGDIQLLAPNGKIVVGVEGAAPPASAGLVTQGAGNIQLYSQGSVLLGLSRIMTTFGGNIFAWTAEGDINAGRGAKTTVLYTPPKRVYDNYGNVKLSPQVPSAGAGIATLNPIPEVKPGDIDLIAPVGTIDVGEAGIRVSGNINLAALQIVNAANISVQGTSSGIPTVQAPSITAALASSNATAATQQTTTPNQGSGNERPSVIIVEVLGYGGGDGDQQAPDERSNRKRRDTLNYDRANPVRVLGNGPVSPEESRMMTNQERKEVDEEAGAQRM